MYLEPHAHAVTFSRAIDVVHELQLKRPACVTLCVT